MNIIQQRKSSICRIILLIVLLEFTFVDNSISNQKTCGSRNTGSISYFKVDREEVTWNEAWRLCNNNSSTLPIICDQHEQDALTNYLKVNIGSSVTWTAGRKITFDEWKWVDGQSFNSRGVIPVSHESYTHVVLDQIRNYRAQHPGSKICYLCQYSDSSCKSENVINVTKGCVIPSDDDRSCYDARNRCIVNDGDLAIFNDSDLNILKGSNKLNAAHSYWIGLRKNTWQWKWQGTVPSGDSCEEVKYSNWPNDWYSLSGECISINASNGGWKAVRCFEKKKVVCERIHTSSSTEISTMSSMSSKLSQSISESTTQTMNEAHSNISSCSVLLTSVVVVCLCVIIISNIIVALVVRKYYLRRVNTSSYSEETGTKVYQDLGTTRRQTNLDGTYTELQLQPVYEEVSKRGH